MFLACDCNSNGRCDAYGQCQCNNGYTGSKCEQGNVNPAKVITTKVLVFFNTIYALLEEHASIKFS